MEASKKKVIYTEANKRFLIRSYTSKEEFLKQYKRIYCDETKAKVLHYQLLYELKKSILEDAPENFKRLSNFLNYIKGSENGWKLVSYEDDANPLKNVNLLILACQYNSTEIVKHMFDNYSTILVDLFLNSENKILPDDEDETCHTAFYYAIRSGNVEVLETLIDKWPGNYLTTNSEKLDEILSKTYEELKLKNVLLSKEVEIFVEDKLINLRFFSCSTKKVTNYKISLSNINERIQIVLENISLLHTYFEVDEKFIFTSKCIAQNISILKQQLKSTYDMLPWEEIEFCLVSFVSSYIKKQEINLFYQVTLNRTKILKHLTNFANKLESVRDGIQNYNVYNLAILPKINRNVNVTKIINNNPQFKELYKDYQEIRDIHSLEKISSYVKLASSANPKGREGQLIIIRSLQVIGEYLKNTLESPKLSSSTSEILLLSLPSNTRNVFISLRNSLSHVYSVTNRMEIEQNYNIDYFMGIQNDTRKIGTVTTYVLYKNKIKIIKGLLKKVVDIENIDELKEIAPLFKRFNLDSVVKENFNLIEFKILDALIKELNKNVIEKTDYVSQIFKKMNDIISYEESKLNNIAIDFCSGASMLSNLYLSLLENNIDSSDIKLAKYYAARMLEKMTSTNKSYCLKEIAELSVKLYRNCLFKIECDNLHEIDRLTCKIINIARFETANIKYVEKLKESLNKTTFIVEEEETNIYSISDEKYDNELTSKLSELQNILSSNALNDNMKITIENRNEKLQAVLEMLILDILSILGSSKNYLENNLLFLDENTPLLIGKCLRNHLAHDNTLIDVLLSDPSITVILNAKKLTMENLISNKKKIGRSVREDPDRFKSRYNQGLETILHQQKMFVALEEGSLEFLKSNIAKGADINGQNINLQTALHFAAKGHNLEVVRFLVDRKLIVNVKDMNGWSPLHVAAASGSTSIVQFFIKEKKLCINDKDNDGRTALHHAARNGHKETAEVLLKHKADINIKDNVGYSPLHYAITHNHKDVFETLISKEASVDNNEAIGGFTPLHLAANKGHLDILNYLLKHKANIFTQTDKGATPLHLAAVKGHLEAVNALILTGSNVNTKNREGSTSLHHAVEYGYEKIVSVLLTHGADANATDNGRFTPLHYAAKGGYEEIVNILLNNGANTTVTEITPLDFAIKEGHLNIVNALLKHDASVIIKNKIVLNLAIEYDHKDIAELLINYKVDVNVEGISNITSIHMAAIKGNRDIIRLLIKNNADVNVKDVNGSTPLHAAVNNDITEIVNILIQNKADVNARTNSGMTPMHVAAIKGNTYIIDLLIKNNSDVNATTHNGLQPLHLAAKYNHKDAVNFLIKNRANINAKDDEGKTALHIAVESGCQEALEVLIANKSNVNTKNKYTCTALSAAVKLNHSKIVKVLIANGADVNDENGQPLLFAVLSGNKDIVEILIWNKARIDFKYDKGVTLLHVAVTKNLESIVNILIKNGIDVNCPDLKNTTPLFNAAGLGHVDIVKILVENGANVNFENDKGLTPLHLAASEGYANVIDVLLDNGADTSVKSNKEISTPLEVAIALRHFESVKTLLQKSHVNINAAGIKGHTLLHIAAVSGPQLDVIKLLIDNGADINAMDPSGAKPIHFAASKDYKDIVEFFIAQGQSINELGSKNQVLLHYAALSGQLKVAEYLVERGADVNAQDFKRTAPIHLAAVYGHTEVVAFLLENGAFYDVTDENSQKPVEMCMNEDLVNSLIETEMLFTFVNQNNAADILDCIEGGAFVNAKNTDNETPLHHAVWKGYEDIVNNLLKNNGNPNVRGKNGWTPLHYAAKFSRLKITKVLLANGAMYDATSEAGKTPLDMAEEKNIINLLKIIGGAFHSIKNGTHKFINELKKITNIDTAKAIMGAVNRENETLIIHAIHNNFAKLEQLKQLWQDDTSDQLRKAVLYFERGQYDDALSIYTRILNKRKETFGVNSPSTLDIQYKIANVYYKQYKFPEALNLLEETYKEQKSILGPDAKDTLATRSSIALILYKQSRADEALEIFEEILEKQRKTPDIQEIEILTTRCNIALVLQARGELPEALKIFQEVFEGQKKLMGARHVDTIMTQSRIAQLLERQGKRAEAAKFYPKPSEVRKATRNTSGIDDIKRAHGMAQTFLSQKNYSAALAAYEKLYETEHSLLGPDHHLSLNSRQNVAGIYLNQGKLHSALQIYKELHERKIALMGLDHPEVQNIETILETVENALRQDGVLDFVGDTLESQVKTAITNDDVETVRLLLADRGDVNERDADGRTLLHFAADRGNADVVKTLLERGADVARVSDKGNTALHTASSRGFAEVAEVLLSHASRDKLNELLNAKTSARGTTALHVAAKSGYFAIAKSLLRHGAMYDVENLDNEKPLDLAKDQNVNRLLTLIGEVFECAQNGDKKVIDKIEAVNVDEFAAITNARNNQGKSLIQIAIIHKHQELASKLLKMLKKPN